VGDKLAADHILPTMDDWEVYPHEAAAVAMKAQEQGLARIKVSFEEELENAKRIIGRSRNLTQLMMNQGFIAKAPEEAQPVRVDTDTLKAAY
jgi:malate dehydrogenase (oxaloacetate-decarboxylating)